jgi:hypothetical protein
MGNAMPEIQIRGYITVPCTCGIVHRVCVTQEPQVQTFAVAGTQANPCRPHTIVFYCEGCGRKKTAEYGRSDIVPVTPDEENQKKVG